MTLSVLSQPPTEASRQFLKSSANGCPSSGTLFGPFSCLCPWPIRNNSRDTRSLHGEPKKGASKLLDKSPHLSTL